MVAFSVLLAGLLVVLKWQRDRLQGVFSDWIVLFLQEKELNRFRSSGNRCFLRLLGINLLLFCLMIWINLCQLQVPFKKWVEKLCTSVDLLKVRADNCIDCLYITHCSHPSALYLFMFHVFASGNVGIEFNDAKSNCGIVQVLGILLWNSCNFSKQQKFAIRPL